MHGWMGLFFSYVFGGDWFLDFLYVMPSFIQCIILSYLERKHTHRGSFFDLKIGNCSASHAGLSHSVRYGETLGVSFGILSVHEAV